MCASRVRWVFVRHDQSGLNAIRSTGAIAVRLPDADRSPTGHMWTPLGKRFYFGGERLAAFGHMPGLLARTKARRGSERMWSADGAARTPSTAMRPRTLVTICGQKIQIFAVRPHTRRRDTAGGRLGDPRKDTSFPVRLSLHVLC